MLRFLLKKLMEEKGATYRQVSEGAKISTSTLQKVANNQNVETDVIDRLLNYFDCEPNDLIVRVKGEDSV